MQLCVIRPAGPRMIVGMIHFSRLAMRIRAGPQNEKWPDRQITENPTGSMHKEARKKKFDPKKVDFD